MPYLSSALFSLLIALSGYSSPALAHNGEKHKGSDTVAEPSPPTTAGIQITITDGWLTAGPEVIKVKQGERVVLNITSDEADELHIHGYDITLPLTANTPATLSFTAKHAGRFGYELHHVHREIGAIEVHP